VCGSCKRCIRLLRKVVHRSQQATADLLQQQQQQISVDSGTLSRLWPLVVPFSSVIASTTLETVFGRPGLHLRWLQRFIACT
jgi:hypothetical protein